MFSKLGWLLLILGVLFARAGILRIVEMIEADDPSNPAVIDGFHYPASAFLYAFFISVLLVIPSAISITRKEASRFYTLIFSIPALAYMVFFILVTFFENIPV